MEQVYCVIDLKSFYASCECVARGLDPFSVPLAVCDKSRSVNSVVMSVSMFLKSRYHVPNVCRRKDLPELEDLILATPRMAYYLEMSAKVVSIFLDYVDEEDLHVYSVDESFLYLTPYLQLYGCTPIELVRRIQKRIKDELGLTASAGLGPNMFVAKACLDNQAKKKPPFIAWWKQSEAKEHLWKISPITEVWGISTGISTRLYRLGIRSMEGLAKCDVSILKTEFGIIGEQLHDLANGIDRSDIHAKYAPAEISLSHAQVLPKDYSVRGAELVLLEMVDDLCFRLRMNRLRCGCVHCFVGYSSFAEADGFSRQSSLLLPTDDNRQIFQAILEIYRRFVVDKPIRHLGIGYAKLTPSHGNLQFSLFENEKEVSRRASLYQTLDRIAIDYGPNAVLRASSRCKDSTIIERHGYIGGHKA